MYADDSLASSGQPWDLRYLRKYPAVIHPQFGNLSRPDIISMPPRHLKPIDSFKENEDIIIHLTVTGRCYARCEGCINSAVTFNSDERRNLFIRQMESEPERDSAKILRLVRNCADQMVTLAFYGGEPFLATDKMERVRLILSDSELKDRVRYMVYTNGELLIQAINSHPDLVQNIWLYSVSIDGSEQQHRRVRKGTDLARIIANLTALRSCYDGNVLFWSTLREQQSLFDCFDEFLKLYQEGLVNHFFWHWAEAVEPYEDFPVYVIKYGQELEKVMETYISRLSHGELLPIAHLNELILYLISGKERGHTACGVELARNYDVMAGRIYACADLPPSLYGPEENDSLDFTETTLRSLVEYKNQLGCYQCGVHPYCGGRCPVQALVGSPERTMQICQLMRLHVAIAGKWIDDIIDGLTRNGISLQDIYDRSAYIARYTDVVP